MRLPIIALSLFATSATAQGLTVQFQDGAPKDSITLLNAGCAITNATVTLDLNGSNGGLIFDTSAQGAGVEVFQPVEVLTENVTAGAVTDGDTTLDISVGMLPTDAMIRLTADLDDTIVGGRQITVSGSEIAGATVAVAVDDHVTKGVFGDDGLAYIDMTNASTGCLPS